MQKTTIMLPPDLKRRALDLAESRDISLGELIRESLEATVRGEAVEVEQDPLYADTAVYDGTVPGGLSEHHDRYLYPR